MKPYNAKAKCPKCGHGTVSSVFCAAGNWLKGIEAFDRIVRCCQRCGYGWNEEPLKAKRGGEHGER